MKKKFESYDAYGTPCFYAICFKCKRGIGVTGYGILRRHYKGRTKTICSGSGRHYTGKRKFDK